MTKTYKHKKTWRIAELNKDWWYDVKHSEGNFHFLHPRIIEDCNDREEVVEKDWVGKCVDEIFEYQRWRPWDEPDYVSIRKIIEKHLPQPTLIKFTRNDLWEFSEKHFLHLPYNRVVEWMIIFLKAHNLYSDTD